MNGCSPSEHLEKAADVMFVRGWVRGRAQSDDGVCLNGALGLACGIEHPQGMMSDFSGDPEAWEAYLVMAEECAARYGDWGGAVIKDRPFCNPWYANDTLVKDAAEAEDILRFAAKRAAAL